MSLENSFIYSYISPGEKAPIKAPEAYYRYNVSLEPNGGVAKLQHTFYPIDVVLADPSAVTWYDWAGGDVSVNTDARLVGAVTAIRVVVISGNNVKLVVNHTDA